MKMFVFISFLSTFLFAQHKLPLNIAHRGASYSAPENTIAAMKIAIKQKTDALEIDVRMTKDGELIVLHDTKVNRTTNGVGYVSELSFEELHTLDAGSWFSKQFANEKIPVLSEILSLIDSSLLLIIEIKSTETGIEQKVIDEVLRSGKKDRVILKSFYPKGIELFKQLAPEIPRIYVFAFHWELFNFTFGTVPRFENIFTIPAEYLQIHYLAISRSFVKKAHTHQYKVIVWGVNSEEAMKEMIELGVDGIETDHPYVLHKIKNNFDLD